MGTKITQERKEMLRGIQREINELNKCIDKVLDGKASMIDIANHLSMSNSNFRNIMEKGLYSILKSNKVKIFNNEEMEDILRSMQTPIEKLYQDVFRLRDDEILFIRSVDHKYIEDKLKELIGSRWPQKYDVIRMVYGINCEPMTHREIAEHGPSHLTKSPARIKQIHDQVLRILSHPSRLKFLLVNADIKIKELQELEDMKDTLIDLCTSIDSIKNTNKTINPLELKITALDLQDSIISKLWHIYNCRTINDVVTVLNNNIRLEGGIGPVSIQKIKKSLLAFNIEI